MRVCLILEGCYPYVRGGVSSWTHDYILSNSDIEFVLWTIQASKKQAKEPLYDIPSNVIEIREVFLDEAYDLEHINKSKAKESNKEYISALSRFVQKTGISWDECISFCLNNTSTGIFSSESFLDFATEVADKSNGKIGLSDAFYGLRSILMPISYLLKQQVPEADIYHSAVAGYGGILGVLAKQLTNKPFVLTEHGIYPREREEELMQADWVVDSMRQMWIDSFYNLSKCAYSYADKVTSLFQSAQQKQIEIGCDKNKCYIISNGINVDKFSDIPMHSGETINIGAFVRFAPIKDIKTLIYAFYNLQSKVDNVTLYIMGGTDDEIYKEECESLIQRLNVNGIKILGHINTTEYMKDMDFTVMSSISEGQPLAILESLASGRPCVTTNVGNCSEILESNSDGIGVAGICSTPMDIEALASNMMSLCINTASRIKMGENGKKRVLSFFTQKSMIDKYKSVYCEVLK